MLSKPTPDSSLVSLSRKRRAAPFDRCRMLPLIFAHLFSMSHVRDLFSRQVMQGKGPIPAAQQPEPVEA